MMNCPQCQCALESGTRFCGRCGAQIQQEAQPQPSSQKALTAAVIIASVLALTGLILAIVFGAKSCSSGSESAGAVQQIPVGGNGAPTANANRITAPNGALIVEDSRIDTTDTATQMQIENYILSNNIAQQVNAFNSNAENAAYCQVSLAAQGNTMVTSFTFSGTLSEYNKPSLQNYILNNFGNVTLASERNITGIPNLMELLVIYNPDGSVYYSKLII